MAGSTTGFAERRRLRYSDQDKRSLTAVLPLADPAPGGHPFAQRRKVDDAECADDAIRKGDSGADAARA